MVNDRDMGKDRDPFNTNVKHSRHIIVNISDRLPTPIRVGVRVRVRVMVRVRVRVRINPPCEHFRQDAYSKLRGNMGYMIRVCTGHIL